MRNGLIFRAAHTYTHITECLEKQQVQPPTHFYRTPRLSGEHLRAEFPSPCHHMRTLPKSRASCASYLRLHWLCIITEYTYRSSKNNVNTQWPFLKVLHVRISLQAHKYMFDGKSTTSAFMQNPSQSF